MPAVALIAQRPAAGSSGQKVLECDTMVGSTLTAGRGNGWASGALHSIAEAQRAIF
jgi:hypothetical protein